MAVSDSPRAAVTFSVCPAHAAIVTSPPNIYHPYCDTVAAIAWTASADPDRRHGFMPNFGRDVPTGVVEENAWGRSNPSTALRNVRSIGCTDTGSSTAGAEASSD